MKQHPYIKAVTFTPTGQTAKDLERIRAAQTVTAVAFYKARDKVIYTDAAGAEYGAEVKTRHRDGTYTVVLTWWLINESWSGSYIGTTMGHVDGETLSVRTRAGLPISRVPRGDGWMGKPVVE